MLIDISSKNKAFIIIFIISPSEQIRRLWVIGKSVFFVSMSRLRGLVCRDNREILCRLDSLLRRRTTSDSSSEFLKIENRQKKQSKTIIIEQNLRKASNLGVEK